ncbi:MAG: hypothetical protein WC366_03000 [Bacilli bacterium]|jgi:hypothetical protein
MKHLLFAVFENGECTKKVINALSRSGINGTAIASTSLKHILHSIQEDSQDFITLRHLEQAAFEDNTTFYSVLEEKEIRLAQEIIRDVTDHFKKNKGGMFVLPLEDYEGSF